MWGRMFIRNKPLLSTLMRGGGEKRVQGKSNNFCPSLRSSGVEMVHLSCTVSCLHHSCVLLLPLPRKGMALSKVFSADEIILQALMAEGSQQADNAFFLEGKSGLYLSIIQSLWVLLFIFPKLELVLPQKYQIIWFICTFGYVHSTCLLSKF